MFTSEVNRSLRLNLHIPRNRDRWRRCVTYALTVRSATAAASTVTAIPANTVEESKLLLLPDIIQIIVGYSFVGAIHAIVACHLSTPHPNLTITPATELEVSMGCAICKRSGRTVVFTHIPSQLPTAPPPPKAATAKTKKLFDKNDVNANNNDSNSAAATKEDDTPSVLCTGGRGCTRHAISPHTAYVVCAPTVHRTPPPGTAIEPYKYWIGIKWEIVYTPEPFVEKRFGGTGTAAAAPTPNISRLPRAVPGTFDEIDWSGAEPFLTWCRLSFSLLNCPNCKATNQSLDIWRGVKSVQCNIVRPHKSLCSNCQCELYSDVVAPVFAHELI